MRAAAYVCVIVAVGGCYSPEREQNCSVSCAASQQCPEGEVCGLDDMCRQPGALDCNRQVDAGIDALPDALAAACRGWAGFEVCYTTPPILPRSLDGMIDTDSSNECEPTGGWSLNQPDACVILGLSITIDVAHTVTAVGTRPLLLIAANGIDISGQLNVASFQGQGLTGAGTQPSFCSNGIPPVMFSAGGAGGSFRSKGGNGGTAQPNLGGQAAQLVGSPGVLRGGCKGQTGAEGGMGQNNGGASGEGGGAVFLAGGTISITGIINASGAGGLGASNNAGGGGGGSGGMVALWATSTIVGNGVVIASGGGGGGGGGGGVNGTGGTDPDPSQPDNASSGGEGRTAVSPFYGHGGEGSIGMGGGANGVDNGGTGGGGGGGGGAGEIRANQPIVPHTSPPVHSIP